MKPEQRTAAPATQWFRLLLLCQAAELLREALGTFLSFGSVSVWLSRVLAVAAIAALFRLEPFNARYRKAAIFSCIATGGGIVFSLLHVGALPTLALAVFSILASYHELNAHSEFTAPKDAKLSGRWRTLFYFELFGGLPAGLLGGLLAAITVLTGQSTDRAELVTTVCVAVVSVALDFVHALYLKQTLALCAAE